MSSIGESVSFRSFNSFTTEEEFDQALGSFSRCTIYDVNCSVDHSEVGYRNLQDEISNLLTLVPEIFGLQHFSEQLLGLNALKSAFLQNVSKVDWKGDRGSFMQASNVLLGELTRFFGLERGIDLDNSVQTKALFALAILQKQFLSEALEMTNRIGENQDEYTEKLRFIQKIQIESFALLLGLGETVGNLKAHMAEPAIPEIERRIALVSELLLESAISFFAPELKLRKDLAEEMESLNPILTYHPEIGRLLSSETDWTPVGGWKGQGWVNPRIKSYAMSEEERSAYVLIPLEQLKEARWKYLDPNLSMNNENEKDVLKSCLEPLLEMVTEDPLGTRIDACSFEESESNCSIDESIFLKRYLLPFFDDIQLKLKLRERNFAEWESAELSYLRPDIQRVCIERLKEMFSCEAVSVKVLIEKTEICINPETFLNTHSYIEFTMRKVDRVLARFGSDYSPKMKVVTVTKLKA